MRLSPLGLDAGIYTFPGFKELGQQIDWKRRAIRILDLGLTKESCTCHFWNLMES